jgi:spermidine synthase
MLGYPFFARKFPRWIFVSAAMVALIFIGNSFIPKWTESRYGSSVATLSDNTATVSVFSKGRDSYLTVNHISMTSLTTITKMMVHFPLLLREKPPESILVICFGMGTTFRSALSWGVPTYAVELVPSVPKMFSHFHPDAAKSLNDPNGRIVIDDGRRFLKHVQEKFDLITLDPPPPFDSAASGMLYSTEFYEEAKQKLKPGGLLQQWWYTSEDSWLIEAAIRSAVKVFPYVMIFPSVEGWGYHILGSNDPIMVPSIATALARLPAAAARDMTEWEAGSTPEKVIGKMLNRGLRPMEIPGFSATGPLITDDLPLNEYYFLRKSR